MATCRAQGVARKLWRQKRDVYSRAVCCKLFPPFPLVSDPALDIYMRVINRGKEFYFTFLKIEIQAFLPLDGDLWEYNLFSACVHAANVDTKQLFLRGTQMEEEEEEGGAWW